MHVRRHVLILHIAGHRHRDQCRRHRHSGISVRGTGAFPYRTRFPDTGTGLLPASAFLLISVPDCHLTPYSPAFKSMEDGEGYTLHVCTAGGGEGYTQLVSFANVRQRYTLHVWWWWWCGWIHPARLYSRRWKTHAPCKSTLLAVLIDTLCKSTLQTIEGIHLARLQCWAGIFKKSMGAKNRGGRPARLHRLAEFIPWNQFRGPINI